MGRNKDWSLFYKSWGAGGLAETVVFTGLEVLLVVAVALPYYLVEVPALGLPKQENRE